MPTKRPAAAPAAEPATRATPGADASQAALSRYRAKRDFGKTPEPDHVASADAAGRLSFVIQKHAATRLHYDFRLELDGVLLSWAVPKGPSFDPADKRMAVRTEDHPLSYAGFEGTIPPKQYGAGTVIVWDRGSWQPQADPRAGLAAGKLVFTLAGHKLAGLWELVRIQKAGERQEPWLLFKKRDEFARPRTDYDVVVALPDSVIGKPLPLLAVPAAASTAAAGPASTASGPAADLASATPAALPGAVAAPLPEQLSPQLATLAGALPPAGDWVHEIKFDGYRLLARVERGSVALITRNGHDWTAKMPLLAKAVKALTLDSAWLDGEIVVLNDDGVPDFNALQNAFDAASTGRITYYLFDLPYLDGHDLREAPLRARRDLLAGLLERKKAGDPLRFSADFGPDGAGVLDAACKMNLEGVIAKRADAPYRSRRSETWLKLKCHQRQEFVVCGFTERAGEGSQVGSLLLGVHEDANGSAGRLQSVGSVGTGWDAETASALREQLAALEVAAPPFQASAPLKSGRWPRRTAGSERWVTPRMVVEVAFAGWTPDNQIRHASFVGVRTDKPAEAVTRERAVSYSTMNRRDDKPDSPARPATQRVGTKGRAGQAGKPAARDPAKSAGEMGTGTGIKVSNPQRVIDASSGATKLDLVRYYDSVAERILPHLTSRPVSLVRGPNGIGGQLFFQKHGDKIGIPGITELDEKLWPGHDALIEVATREALLGAAQMNVIEFHTWNSTVRHIDKPDRMVFDLDPGDGVAWPMIREGALLMRALLQQLGLQSWLKTSGGKGLHVVVPTAPRWDYDTAKAFSQAIVQHLAKTIPQRFVAVSGPANRVGKIFVDYLRNGHGATTAIAFSARARAGLGVSMPVSWEQLDGLKGGAQWTIATAREHMSFETDDPWAAYWTARQSLTAAMKALGFKPPPAKAKAR